MKDALTHVCLRLPRRGRKPEAQLCLAGEIGWCLSAPTHDFIGRSMEHRSSLDYRDKTVHLVFTVFTTGTAHGTC
jgi:hypothetical protein